MTVVEDDSFIELICSYCNTEFVWIPFILYIYRKIQVISPPVISPPDISPPNFKQKNPPGYKPTPDISPPVISPSVSGISARIRTRQILQPHSTEISNVFRSNNITSKHFGVLLFFILLFFWELFFLTQKSSLL